MKYMEKLCDEVQGNTMMKYKETLWWSIGKHYNEVQWDTMMKYK